MMEREVCKNLWVRNFGVDDTYGYGEEKPRPHEAGIRDLSELYLHAINRGINIDLPTQSICDSISEQIPSIKWQKSVMLAMGDRNLVSIEELRLVNNYATFYSDSINEDLRLHPNHEHFPHTINKIIKNMPPIDKDIVTFRKVNENSFLPTKPGDIFVSYGYLSTTMDAYWVARGVCESSLYIYDKNKNRSIIKLHIPKGTKAIYLPGDESEILLPHNIRLKLLNITNQKFMCPLKKNKQGQHECQILNNIPIYEFQLL